MTPELCVAFIATTAILGLIPGPNVALTVANSVTYGPRYGLMTVAGTGSAMIPQLALTVLGMSTMLTAMAGIFEILRWIGVAYLLYIGYRQWVAPPVNLTGVKAEPKSMKDIFWRGFLVSTTNPKTLLFYGAFFPQFIDIHGNVPVQLITLSAIFIAVIVTIDSGWALLAGSVRRFLVGHGTLRNRISGGFMMAAAAGLAFARKST